MLNSLVLPDRTIEHHALARIFCRTAQRILTDPDRLDRDQDALGIEAVQNIGKALALLADPVGAGDKEPVDKDGIRIDRLAAHFRNSMPVALRPIELGREDPDCSSPPVASSTPS